MTLAATPQWKRYRAAHCSLCVQILLMSPSALATPGIPSPGHHWETLLLIHLTTPYLAKHTLGLGFVGVLGLPVMLHKSFRFPEFLWLFDHLVASLLDAKLDQELLCWVKSEERRGCVRVRASEKPYTLKPSNRTCLHTCMHACVWTCTRVFVATPALVFSSGAPHWELCYCFQACFFSDQLWRCCLSACLLTPPHSLSFSLSLYFSLSLNRELRAALVTQHMCLPRWTPHFSFLSPLISLQLPYCDVYFSISQMFQRDFLHFCVPAHTVPALPVCKLIKYIAKNIWFQLWTWFCNRSYFMMMNNIFQLMRTWSSSLLWP